MQANRAMRANHDMKLVQKSHRLKAGTAGIQSGDVAFGRQNRPQTPVNGIINNEYGEVEHEALQARYEQWKQHVS